MHPLTVSRRLFGKRLAAFASGTTLLASLPSCMSGPTPGPTSGPTSGPAKSPNIIYGYARLDVRRYGGSESSTNHGETGYEGQIEAWATQFVNASSGKYQWGRFDGDRRRNWHDPKGDGFHKRPKLETLIGYINYDAPPSTLPNTPPDTSVGSISAGDVIVVVKLSHFSAESAIMGRLIQKIARAKADLVVIESKYDTTSMDDKSKQQFWSLFDGLASAGVIQPDSRPGVKGDGGGDGGGNGL